MDRLIIILLDGIAFASWLFLVAVGLTFAFGVLRILNIAHGSIYAIGAYMGATFAGAVIRADVNPYLTYPALVLAAVVAGLLVGPAMEWTLLRRVYRQQEVVTLLLTFSIFLVLEDVMKLVWGVSPIMVPEPYALLGQLRVAGVSYPLFSFLLTAVAIAAGVGLWAMVNRTRFGKIIIAVAADREISAAVGVDVPRVYMVAFTIAAVLAALGGAFTAPMVSVVPGLSADAIVFAFAVTVIGGLGNVLGSALGALLVGVLRAAAVQFVPALDLFVVYALMVAILLVRPEGLFGGMEVRRI
jgi:branched-chain amino acid transport system permease protein